MTSSPFRNRKTLPLMLYQAGVLATRVIPPIGVLFSTSCPPAIARFVVAVSVLTLNAVALAGSIPHVGVEVLERFEPAGTDGDTPAAVIFVPKVLWVGASGNHVPVRDICECMRKSMLSVTRGLPFPLEAAATFGFQFSKVACSSDLLASTITQAPPEIVTGFTFAVETENREASVPPSNQIQGRVIIGDSHDKFLSLQGRLWLEPADVSASDRLASFYNNSQLPDRQEV